MVPMYWATSTRLCLEPMEQAIQIAGRNVVKCVAVHGSDRASRLLDFQQIFESLESLVGHVFLVVLKTVWIDALLLAPLGGPRGVFKTQCLKGLLDRPGHNLNVLRLGWLRGRFFTGESVEKT